MPNNAIKVVIIDDDQDDFLLLKNLFAEIQGTEYQLSWISRSAEATEAIKLQSADVYLIDYRLDNRTGLDILDELQDADINKALILMTGFADRSVDLAAMERGAAHFLPKDSLTADHLERAIRYSMKRMQEQEKLKQIQALKIEKEAAVAANQLKSKFLAYISHEIRSPLSAVLGFSDLALDPETSAEEKVECVQIIKKSCEKLILLINDLLDLSKVEAGKIETILENVPWRNVVAEVVQLFKPQADQKGIQIQCLLQNEIPEVLKTDAQRLRQILSNLVSNAIKFTSHGIIRIECQNDIGDSSSSGDFVLSVRDTGIGISAEDQKKLFQPYQQATIACQRKFGGTGLGLELSRKLANVLGGDLRLIDSKPGIGSVFSIILPGIFVIQNVHYGAADAHRFLC